MKVPLTANSAKRRQPPAHPFRRSPQIPQNPQRTRRPDALLSIQVLKTRYRVPNHREKRDCTRPKRTPETSRLPHRSPQSGRTSVPSHPAESAQPMTCPKCHAQSEVLETRGTFRLRQCSAPNCQARFTTREVTLTAHAASARTLHKTNDPKPR